MAKTFAKPDQVRENLEATTLLFSDQMPFWVMISSGRQLYGPEERRGNKRKADDPTVMHMSQRFEDANEEPGAKRRKLADKTVPLTSQRLEDGNEERSGKTQTRGRGVSEQDRYRITFELCSAVEKWFGPSSVRPVGRVMPSSIVLIGSHGRLSNIDSNGNFIEDECFTWRGKPTVRRAGTSARGLLAGWVKMRTSIISCSFAHFASTLPALEIIACASRSLGLQNYLSLSIYKERARDCEGHAKAHQGIPATERLIRGINEGIGLVVCECVLVHELLLCESVNSKPISSILMRLRRCDYHGVDT